MRDYIYPFAPLIFLAVFLYFGLRCAEWWLEPPPVHFPTPIVSVQPAITASEEFPNGNYYVVPQNLRCTHTRTPKALTIVCKPH
jgi:hypothetical protein